MDACPESILIGTGGSIYVFIGLEFRFSGKDLEKVSIVNRTEYRRTD